MQWIFPADNLSIVLGAVQAEDQVHACPLVLVDGEALGSGWILSGEKRLRAQSFYSQHDHLCEGQENLI